MNIIGVGERNANQHGAIEWSQLHSERQEVGEALLRNVKNPPKQKKDLKLDEQLQTRLRLIDDAMDRLMNGSYGDCVKCGRWIEDTKLHSDPAFPFCHGCERELQVSPPRPQLR